MTLRSMRKGPCEECADSGAVVVNAGTVREREIPCKACCPHDERDHGICLDCEHETSGAA